MMIKRHRDIHGWESLNHYLGGPPQVKVPGYKSETMQFGECGLPDWSSYRIKLDLNEYFVYSFVRWVLRLPRPPNPWVWLTSTEVLRYLEFRVKHSEEYLLYLKRRRVRLGPNWQTEWFALTDRQRSVILLTEEEFRNSFVPDPGAPSYSAVASSSEAPIGSYLEPIQIRVLPNHAGNVPRSTEPPSVGQYPRERDHIS
jgi:hypothetical protein